MNDLSKRIAALSPAQRSLLEQKLKQRQSQDITPSSIPVVAADTTYPLSFAQQRLWFLHQLDPQSPLYNLAAAVRLRGQLQTDILERSLNTVRQRHTILRSRFITVEGEPRQAIMLWQPVTLPLIDLQSLSTEVQQSEIQRYSDAIAKHTFDLSQDAPVRMLLLRLAADDHLLLVVLHHIVSDGWSKGLLIQEVATLYQAFLAGKPSPLRELSIQYKDFAVWQQQQAASPEFQAHLAYWRQQLGDSLPILQLPINQSAQRPQANLGRLQTFSLSAKLTAQLQQFSQQEGVTLFMTLLAAFQVLLYRYSGQTDICVGTPTAGRSQPQLESLIGCFINPVVLRSNLSGNPNFRAFLHRLRATATDVYSHADLPFEALVESLQPDRSTTPLFQAMFALQNVPRANLELPDLTLEVTELHSGTSKFDLTLAMEETAQGLTGMLEYCCDRIDDAAIIRLQQHFQTLLESIVTNPNQRLSELAILPPTERQQLLVEWNQTPMPLPNCSIHALFEQQVKRTPAATALVFEDQYLTYQELNQQANQLAHYLQTLGVGSETLVGICLERSPLMLIALLAVLKAGAAYVPLDPSFPAERLHFMVQDSQIALIVTQASLSDLLLATVEEQPYQPQVLCLDTALERLSQQPQSTPDVQVDASNLAYLIYTSGSTGKPKGVMIEHRSVVNFLLSLQHHLHLTAQDRLLAVTTLSFDIAVLELLLPLVTGAQVAIAPYSTTKDALQLIAALETTQATVMQATPATWRMLLNAGWSGKSDLTILSGGEALPTDLAEQLLTRSQALWNLYGPTETTIWSTLQHITDTTNGIPIGRPIHNTQIYLLDESLQPAPIGVPAELYIGGTGLARGYWHRPDLTTERFIPNPFATFDSNLSALSPQPSTLSPQHSKLNTQHSTFTPKPPSPIHPSTHPLPHASRLTPHASRLYKTGDLARYRPDGTLEHLGRLDHQIKLRGYRIELGEIEAVLRQLSAVKEAVVVAREDEPGDQRLVAYVVLSGEPAQVELKKKLRSHLPEYMVPSAFVALGALPLTPNGKVDRKALPKPNCQPSELSLNAEPQTESEQQIAAIWRQVLKLDHIGREDNFFELGGHSLLATQVISRLRQAFQQEFPIRLLFEAPTIAVLAQQIEQEFLAEPLSEPLNAAQSNSLVIQPAGRMQPLPLSFAQERLWVLDQLQPGDPSYNISTAVELTGDLNLLALEQSLNIVIQRHESLRTTFVMVDGSPVQAIASELFISINYTDLSELPPEQQSFTVQQLIQSEACQPFDLAQGPLLRAQLLCLGKSKHILLFSLHHIIADAWSMGVLVQEMTTCYQALINGKTPALPELPIQYGDFAVWQRQWLQTADATGRSPLQQHLDYWRQQLRTPLPVLQLPTDFPRPAKPSHQGALQSFMLPPDLVRSLNRFSQQQGVSLFMTLLAAFQILLYRYTQQEDIVVGTDVANRNRAETEALIGFLVNILVLRTDLSGNPTFQELLSRMRDVTLDAYAYQDLPFAKLVEALNPTRSLNHTPLFQVLFVLQNAPMSALDLGNVKVVPLDVDNGTAKFDLALFLTETEQGIQGLWNYRSDLFKPETLAQFSQIFIKLLQQVVNQPQASLSELAGLSPISSNAMTAPHRKSSKFKQIKSFKAVQPKPVQWVEEELIQTSYLSAESSLPLVIQPKDEAMDLSDWAEHNRPWLEQQLQQHGAILFRGFGLQSATDFEQVAQAICPSLFGDYGDLPREGMGGKVYGSTPYPAEQAIRFHNESSHLHRWPMKIWFFCVQAAQQGGETPIIDCRKAYQLLSPNLRQRLQEKRLMYVRNFTDGLDVSWQSFFQTCDRTVVEAECRRHQMQVEWIDQGLRTRQIRPAVLPHPKTGDWVLFNQIQLHHIAYLEPSVRQSLLSLFGESNLPRNVYYGDGSPIEESVLAELDAVYEQAKVQFPWQAQDMLMLDNMLVAHGRNPFVGSRKIVVTMGEMICDRDLQNSQVGEVSHAATR
ncbi:MAG: amino acid adenylation domain-containing protein [Thainema sp.]